MGVKSLLRPTLRLRLTALYSGLFLLGGGALLAITYVLVTHTLPRGSLVVTTVVEDDREPGAVVMLPESVRAALREEAARQRDAALQQLLTQSALALMLTAALAVVLGWLVAGRVLRPFQDIIRATDRMSVERLHQRLTHHTDDEFKDLVENLNAMLGRLEVGFAAQRRFAAQASHELLTPLTVQRSAVEVALADPAPTVGSLRRMAERVLESTRRNEELVSGLLVLAQSQEGVPSREPVDLAALARTAIDDVAAEADRAGVEISRRLEAAPLLGDVRLLDRMVGNLLRNAVRHNVPGGWAQVRTGVREGRAFLEVGNSGPVVPADLVDTLFEPFQRHDQARATGGRQEARGQDSRGDGFGLGLSIVVAVSRSHGGTVTARPRPSGGLEVTLWFPG